MKTWVRTASVLALAACLDAASWREGLGVLAPWSPIGVAGAVKGNVRALPPGGATPIGRVLRSGEAVYLGETISTGPDSSLQVMLNDETVFTIGPRSAMVLDRFDYDQRSESGRVVATVKRGLFRFVTGLIGHNKPSNMTVRFPVAVMAVRGTIVAGEVSENGTTTAVLLGPGAAVNASEERIGAFSMTNAGVTVDVVRPGYATQVDSPDSPPTAAARLPSQRLDDILHGLAQAAGAQPALKPTGSPDERTAAREAAGQTRAAAAEDLSATQDISDLEAYLDKKTSDAAEDSEDLDIADLIAAFQASWDDLKSVKSGTGYYDGSDVFTLTQCGGGSCSRPSGNVSMHLDINFGAQTIGSAASNMTISAQDARLSAPINDTVNFPARSFASLTGAANLSGSSASGATQASISVLNFGGVAQSAIGIASYSDSKGTTGSGVVGAMLTCTSGSCH